MSGIKVLRGRVFILTQYYFSSSARTVNIRLFEANINIFNRSLLLDFSTFHSLLKKNAIAEDNSKDNNVRQRQGVKAATETASWSDKKKKKPSDKIKNILLRPEISNHDLQNKFKQIEKFIGKGLIVAVRVENPKNLENASEAVFDKIQKSVNEKQISAKLAKTGPVINIYPIRTDNKANDASTDNKSSSNFNTDTEGKL